MRDYHGYTLPGTTCNAYLIHGEKAALIDSACAGFENQLFGRVASICDLDEID